jgi:predicted permease
MNRLRSFGIRLLNFFSSNHRDVATELNSHLDLAIEENRKAGLSEDEARRQALIELGGLEQTKEIMRDQQSLPFLDALLQDTRYAFRTILRSPGLTAVALLSLSLGIGANTAIFSLMDAVLLKTLPVHDPQSLVLFGNGLDEGISDGFPNSYLFSYPFYRQMQKQNQVFSDVAAAFSMTDRIHGFVQGRVEAEPMSIQLVSGTYFPMLGVRPLVGRMLSEDDDKTEGSHPVAVVSYAWWNRALARDPEVLDKKLTVGTTVFSIVGVAPPEFFGTKVGEVPDIWIPLSMQKDVPPGYGGYADNLFESLHLMARLKPGVTLTQATANANLLFQQILRGFAGPAHTQERLSLLDQTKIELTPMATGFSRLRYLFSAPLKILMVVVGLVLLIACANIANLLLARSTARARELAVRQTLGANRFRLVRQLLTESLMVALTGGALGVLFAYVATHFLVRMFSDGRLHAELSVPIDTRLLLFTFAVSLATALLFGAIPALRATRLDLIDSLKEGRGTSRAATKGPLAKVLVVSQVALSLVLLVGAGLFVRSLLNLTNIDTGFVPAGVIRLHLDPASVGYKEDARLVALYQQIEERVSVLPGVRSASFSIFTFNEGTWNNPIWVQGNLAAHNDQDIHHNVIGPNYFSALGIPLLAGRNFGLQDTASSPKVGIISESTARILFPEDSPIGRHYGYGGPENANDIEVIGVAKDVKYNFLDEPLQFGDYLPMVQTVRYLRDFSVRYSGDSTVMVASVRQAIHDIDPTLPISDAITLNEQITRSISNQRLVAQLSTFFGLLALFLSCIGIYGLMSYLVTRRTNEIGIRMALGAPRSIVLWHTLKESLHLVGIGIAIGLPLAFITARLISSMLFGLRSTDPTSLFMALAILLTIAALACYLPARRASQVDPIIALRYE